MLQMPMDILHQFPVRKTKKQKQIFRDAVCTYAKQLGYPAAEEKGSFGSCNLVIGDPGKADYLVTAHYDTCAWLPVPNFLMPCNPAVFLAQQAGICFLLILLSSIFGAIAGFLLGEGAIGIASCVFLFCMIAMMLAGPANRNNANDNTSGIVTLLEIAKSMPQAARNKTCFILFDLEEKGLVGSRAYQKKHKSETNRQIILNLDCVGDGDEIMLFPTKKMRIRKRDLSQLERICGRFGKKSIKLHRKGVAICPSDHKNFPYAVGVMAFNRKKHIGLYCDRIHTKRDTVLDQTNVNIIRAALVTLICQ